MSDHNLIWVMTTYTLLKTQKGQDEMMKSENPLRNLNFYSPDKLGKH